MVDIPELTARPHRPRHGTPHAVTIAVDGSRVAFLRSAGPADPIERLWVMDLPSGIERMIGDPGDGSVTAYATDHNFHIAAYTTGNRLYRADLSTGDSVELRTAEPATGTTAGPITDPRPDPNGRRIAYLTRGTLRVIDTEGHDALLAGEEGVTWGRAEFSTATEFSQDRGYWWSPDGEKLLVTRVDSSKANPPSEDDPAAADHPRVPHPLAGGEKPAVSLHILDLEGGWVDVRWDRVAYPYLAVADWGDTGPLMTVLRGLQQHGLVLTIDARTGETQVHAELSDPHWVMLVPGTPVKLFDSRVLVAGELVRDGLDARCLFADGTLLTPPGLYPRHVCGVLTDGLLVAGTEGAPEENHLYLISLSPGTPALRLTNRSGWHTGIAGGSSYAVRAQSLDHPGERWKVVTPEGEYEIRDLADEQQYAPRPVLTRVTDRRIPAAVLYPTRHVPGQRLPVLVDAGEGPWSQQVIAARMAWQDRQWWADQGFAVVTIDGRGTLGCSPQYEKVVHHRIGDIALTDHIDALASLATKHPDLDLDQVAIRGNAFGGWLAVAAVLRRPDMFRAAIAHDPIIDWERYMAARAERYLGLPDEQPEVYARHNLLNEAEELTRPLLLVRGDTDDGSRGHTLRLSAALTKAGRRHSVVSSAGAGNPGEEPPGESTSSLEVDFLRRSLGMVP